MRAAQRIVAIGLPCAILATFLIHALRLGVSRNLVLAAGLLFIVSLVLARFLMARSRNQEGKFVTMRVSPDDDESAQRLGDMSAFLVALALFAAAVLIPL